MDVVCGMDIDPDAPATLKLQRNGMTYYFCQKTRRKRFSENPGKLCSREVDCGSGCGQVIVARMIDQILDLANPQNHYGAVVQGFDGWMFTREAVDGLYNARSNLFCA
jgi:YHS domain-containing protein